MFSPSSVGRSKLGAFLPTFSFDFCPNMGLIPIKLTTAIIKATFFMVQDYLSQT